MSRQKNQFTDVRLERWDGRHGRSTGVYVRFESYRNKTVVDPPVQTVSPVLTIQ